MEPNRRENSTHLESIRYSRGNLKVLDQLCVPQELVYCELTSVSDGIHAIKTMQVRGAPLIAIVGCLSLGVHLNSMESSAFHDSAEFLTFLEKNIQDLIDARPTAVNMRREGHRLIQFAKELARNNESVENLRLRFTLWHFLYHWRENISLCNVQTIAHAQTL